MKIKVSDTTKLQLNWLVAWCVGEPEETLDPLTWRYTAYPSGCYSYSTNWAQGGPIIEREKLDVLYEHDLRWLAVPQRGVESYGPTPLIAAMRAFVASKLGDEVEVPDELTG